jgi:hypothetical protein
MDEHSLFPQTEAESSVSLHRIQNLGGHVMRVREWRSMLSASRQLIPRKEKVIVDPSKLNLTLYSASLAGRILAATLVAFSSAETFTNNKRYSIQDWISLARDFYNLALYLCPPPTLEFAAQIITSARKVSDDTFIRSLSVVGRNEPMLVRQVASSSDLDRWHQALVQRLSDSCTVGEEYEGLAGDGELSPDDYDAWLDEAQEIVDLGEGFFAAFNYPRPAEIASLRSFIRDIERPPDADNRDYESDDQGRSGHADPEYWTIERIFEDL